MLALPLLAAALVLVCASLLPAGAEAMGPNDGGADNTLGLLAQACANSFCGRGVDALDLWLSLEEVRRKWIGPAGVRGVLHSQSRRPG